DWEHDPYHHTYDVQDFVNMFDELHQENDDVLYDNNDQEEPIVIQDVDAEVVEMDHVVEET
ncbi:hypothetical protein Tco_0329752, partial [Tanacetum coccineum]